MVLLIFIQACTLVVLFAFFAGITVVGFNPFHDNYYKRLEEFDQASLIVLSPVCQDVQVRHSTRDFHDCERAELILRGSSVLGRAITDTIQDLHPCSRERCDTVFSSVVTIATLAIIVFALFAFFYLLLNVATNVGAPMSTVLSLVSRDPMVSNKKTDGFADINSMSGELCLLRNSRQKFINTQKQNDDSDDENVTQKFLSGNQFHLHFHTDKNEVSKIFSGGHKSNQVEIEEEK